MNHYIHILPALLLSIILLPQSQLTMDNLYLSMSHIRDPSTLDLH